ncbi:MAG: DUF2185 domain-containing protein [Gemmataceae bacterium]|nr:DUF2185 domain-containing protein [Gemmataceae bacterium]
MRRLVLSVFLCSLLMAAACGEPSKREPTSGELDQLELPVAKAKKKFRLRPEEIKELVAGQGYCFATDMITVHGHKVGFMYREKPGKKEDSGWRFFSGAEPQDYVDNPANTAIYDVNTIANLDPEIIPYLDAPISSAFERERKSRRFVKADFPGGR